MKKKKTGQPLFRADTAPVSRACKAVQGNPSYERRMEDADSLVRAASKLVIGSAGTLKSYTRIGEAARMSGQKPASPKTAVRDTPA